MTDFVLGIWFVCALCVAILLLAYTSGMFPGRARTQLKIAAAAASVLAIATALAAWWT